ncbi:phosphatidate cytidylyltransferase [Clostridia bacterium]|nr:phosphatidate cytidylyltransferase [Clostridia bacterium]
MFVNRLISGIVLLILAAVTIISGGMVWFLTLMLLSAIALLELQQAQDVTMFPLGFLSYVFGFVYYIFLYLHWEEYHSLLIVLFFLALVLTYISVFPKCPAEKMTEIFFQPFYVVVMFSYLFRLRMMENGVYLIVLVFFSSWGCDTFAYCVGMILGKHPLVPKLSPKKSIEGAVGGIVGAALLGGIYGFFLRDVVNFVPNQAVFFAILCALGAILSQMGDLLASGIKRNYGIKDYGNLIPGHGGILDRFDSMILIAPVLYYFSLYFLG